MTPDAEGLPGRRAITGVIVLPPGTALPPEASLVVRLENISRADVPSETVGEDRKSGGEVMGATEIPFRIEVPVDQLDDRNVYSVSAHVDLTGSGEVELGDFVSTQSYPVITRGRPTNVRVSVRRV